MSRFINLLSLRHISSHQFLQQQHQQLRIITKTFNNFNFRRHLSFSPQPLQGQGQHKTGKGRPWRRDDILALVTWLLVGTGTFVLIGTTTSASLALLLANSLQFQEFVGGKLSAWITRSLGWKVSFGSAIVPNWRDGRITLRDVSIDLGDIDQSDYEIPPYEVEVPLAENYTRFSIQLDRLDVRISLKRWLEGRGWLEEVLVDGARGVLDKRWVRAIEGWKWKHRPGDFDLNHLQLRNIHLTIVQAHGYLPYHVTILSANVPRLRASWLFYDLLAAESAHGIFDGRSLFTLHTATKATKTNTVTVKDLNLESSSPERELKHFRMLGLDVRHLSQSSADNALGWVTRGTVDIEGFYQMPPDKESARGNVDINFDNFTPETFKEKLLLPLLKRELGRESREANDNFVSVPLKFWYESKIKPKLSDELISLTDTLISLPQKISDRISQRILNSLKDVDFGGLETVEEAAEHFLKASEDSVAFQVDFVFRNLRAKLPAEEINNARGTFLRPVIGYVNEHRPLIPLSCHFIIPQSNFEGAWSGFESGLIGSLAGGLEGAFQKLVWDPERRMQRIGKIGRWTLGNYLKKFNMADI